MYVIRTDDTTPPQVILALKTLQEYTAPSDTGEDLPIVMSHEHSHAVNLTGFQKLFESPIKAATSTGMLMLLGQMLWRYAPLLLELDSRDSNKYMQAHRLTAALPGGRNYRRLRDIYTPHVIRASQSTGMLAQRQMQSINLGQKTRLTDTDYRIIGDYAVVRPGQNRYNTVAASLTLPWRPFKADVNVKGRRLITGQLDTIQRLYDTKWPFMTTAPTYITRTARLKGWHDYRHITVDDDFSQASPLHGLAVLSDARRIPAPNNTSCDNHNPFLTSGELRQGMFYRTPAFTAMLEPMGDDDFGQVDLSLQPFEITLNSRMEYPRVRMSMVHEMLHILTEMHKINLSHEALHEVALLIVNDILPGLGALAEYTQQALFN